MNILVTLQKGETRSIHFPDTVMEELSKLGNVRTNETTERFTQNDLIKNLKDIDFCLTHWGCPNFSEEVLAVANRLKMIAHAAGSVANLVNDHVYEKGIKVCSSNDVMAKYVAEGVLALALAALRKIPRHDRDMKNKISWSRDIVGSRSLYGEKIGLIGLGTVGRYLLELLKPFDVKIKLYDPYISQAALSRYPGLETGSIDEVLAWGSIVSVHASLTPETRHMLGSSQLKLIKDGALLINTARGAVIDQKALETELESGRINAVLDVYEEEPLPVDNPLRDMDNVLLMPHMAGAGPREKMTFAMIDEIRRFIKGEPLKYEIPFEKYRLMTRE